MKNTKHTENLDNSTPQDVTSQSKRKILTSIGVSSGILGASAISQQWTKPIVNSIVLPAHAEPSPMTGGMGTTVAATTTTEAPTGPMIMVRRFPASGMVGDGDDATLYVSLNQMPTVDQQTGMPGTVTVEVSVEPVGSGTAVPDMLTFSTMDVKVEEEKTVVVTAADSVPDDADVMVKFMAEGGGYDKVEASAMFTIVEDDNLPATDVEAERVGDGPDIMVSWKAPATTSEISRYRITDDVTDVVRIASAGATSHTVTGLIANTEYTFSVDVDYKEGDPPATATADPETA